MSTEIARCLLLTIVSAVSFAVNLDRRNWRMSLQRVVESPIN